MVHRNILGVAGDDTKLGNAASLSIVARRKEEKRRRHDLSPDGQTGPGASLAGFSSHFATSTRDIPSAFRYPNVTHKPNVKTRRLVCALFLWINCRFFAFAKF
jgi:hypothetical protein